MLNKRNVQREFDLYEPMRIWLYDYLKDKYKNYEIITVDAHSKKLDRILATLNIDCHLAIDIRIDVLGVARKQDVTKLFFIEAKKDSLTLRDLGQLWAYCKLMDPEEAYLMTSADLGTLDRLINIFHREDLLNFGDGKYEKKMKIVVWNLNTNAPELMSMIAKN